MTAYHAHTLHLKWLMLKRALNLRFVSHKEAKVFFNNPAQKHIWPLLFFLFFSHGTQILWYAVSGAAPVDVLPFKSPQQAKCDEADVRVSIGIWFHRLSPSARNYDTLPPGTFLHGPIHQILTLPLIWVEAASQVGLCWLMAQLQGCTTQTFARHRHVL